MQHFIPISYFGGEKSFLENKENEKIKDSFCKENKITLKRIPYTKFNQLEEIITKIITK